MKRSLTLTVVILGISFNHRWCQFAPLWSAKEMLLYHVLVENDSCMLYISLCIMYLCLGYVNVYFALPTQYHL